MIIGLASDQPTDGGKTGAAGCGVGDKLSVGPLLR